MKLLETLVDAMREAPAQVVVATHSPYLLDRVEPEEVYLVVREMLETEVARLSTTEEAEAVERFLRDARRSLVRWPAGRRSISSKNAEEAATLMISAYGVPFGEEL